MIVAFIAIVGLLLSNKNDVVSFINKHNINWFERNLVSTQFNKISQSDKVNGNVFSDALKSSNNDLIALKTDIITNKKHDIRFMDVGMVSQQPTDLPTIRTTDTVITKPPINSDEITTKFAPAWKSLINKIINSNKNELVASNSVENVHKTWSTVSLSQQKSTTTISTPTKKTTLAPVQHESSKLNSCKNFLIHLNLLMPFILQ